MMNGMITRLGAAVAVAAASALAGAGIASAGSGAAPVAAETRRVEVKRHRAEAPDRPHLVFLKENRVFLRAELDRLRQLVKVTREGQGDLLDPRLLRLRELAAEAAAAGDTLGAAEAALAARRRLEHVEEIAGLEARLAGLEGQLAAQAGRLASVEADYLGEQRTALVVVVGGFAGRTAPAAVVLAEGERSWRVEFTPPQRLALEQGGVAQVHHAHVEPRAHEFSLAFEGDGWQGTPPAVVSVETPRDRLTFLEFDLGGAAAGDGAGGPTAVVWQR